MLNDVLYNLGGGSSNSVEWLDLVQTRRKWNSMKTVGQANFTKHSYGDAGVVSNSIVYFGPFEACYVLEQKEGERGKLEIASEFKGIAYKRGRSNSSFCTYQDLIYFFPMNEQSVFSLDIETEQTSLYF